MPTIVEYTDKVPPRNVYPERIVSPLHSGPCCFSHMASVGDIQRDGNWEYVYRRCQRCGFAVRMIGREVPDEVLAVKLRAVLTTTFRRRVPDL